jgi:hypothetical protein
MINNFNHLILFFCNSMMGFGMNKNDISSNSSQSRNWEGSWYLKTVCTDFTNRTSNMSKILMMIWSLPSSRNGFSTYLKEIFTCFEDKYLHELPTANRPMITVSINRFSLINGSLTTSSRNSNIIRDSEKISWIIYRAFETLSI